MKTAFLIIFLWALAYAHPVPNHMSAHPRSSAKLEDTVSEDNMNELADWDDGQDRSPHASRERGDTDVAGDSHDPADGNDVDEEIAEHNGGAERIRIREAQHKNWVDHEDTSDLDEVEDQHENGLGQHLDEKRFLEEDVHDADNGDQGERYGAESHGSKRYDVGDNRLLYRPTGFFPRGGYRGRSDLVDEEDDSGDDTFDEDEGEEKGEGPTYTVRPNEAGEHDTFGDNDQNGGRRDTGMSRRPHDDSSSSSSESRSLDHREYKNYIASRYGRTYRRRGDSDSSSQEERYDFDNEEMQGDDPSIFDGFGSYSKGLRTAFRSKESSQESSREAGKAVLKVSDQSEEESRSEEFPNGPDDSEEDDSLQHDDSESVEVGDADSREDSQSAEDKSESEEHVTSQSKENSADKSGEDADSRSREDGDSKSREELASQSDEENRSRESQEEDSKEAVSKSSERSGSKSEEGQEDRESAEDNSKPSGLDSESAEDEGDQSESREESESPEDSLESEEDGNDSHPGEDALSRSKSTESQSASHEGASSEEGPTTDSRDGEDSTSAESRNSDSKEEEHSHSAEEDSQSREDATNESAGHGDDSLPRSLEGENRKRRLRVYHDKHVGDYDDTDCQDGY